MFVGRPAYVTNEDRLRREFEIFGPIDKVRLVHNLQGKSKGYAFVTFARERDADNAFSRADGRKIDGRRILVDRELGRTKRTWVPRRLGGGKGGESRRAESDYLVEDVAREIRREQMEQDDKRKEEQRIRERPTALPAKVEKQPSVADDKEPGEI